MAHNNLAIHNVTECHTSATLKRFSSDGQVHYVRTLYIRDDKGEVFTLKLFSGEIECTPGQLELKPTEAIIV